MPELPEVETVRRGLSRLIVGKKVSRLIVDNPKSFPNPPDAVEAFLIGATVTSVERRAKVIMIGLSSNYTLVVHLKMTGQLVYHGEENWGAGHPSDSLINALPDRSTRVTLEFTDGSKLFFNDQRKFGWIKLVATPLVFEMPFLQKVGPEPLEDEFTWQVLKEALSHKQRSKLKPALLDQSVLAGLGNIYVDECLLLSKLHPLSLVSSLSDQQIQILTQNIKLVLQKSIDAGGSSSRNYVDANGKKGNYLDGNYAYKRDGEACRICGTTIEKIKVAGRGTHFCPHCQPTPKEI